jgi:hypothetical protein
MIRSILHPSEAIPRKWQKWFSENKKPRFWDMPSVPTHFTPVRGHPPKMAKPFFGKHECLKKRHSLFAKMSITFDKLYWKYSNT